LQNPHKQYIFHVPIPGRTYKFAADSLIEAKDWLRAFNNVIALCSGESGTEDILASSGLYPWSALVERMSTEMANLERIQREYAECHDPAQQGLLVAENQQIQSQTLPDLFLRLARAVLSRARSLDAHIIVLAQQIESQARQLQTIAEQFRQAPPADLVRRQELLQTNHRILSDQQDAARNLCIELAKWKPAIPAATPSKPTSSPASPGAQSPAATKTVRKREAGYAPVLAS